MTYVWRIEMAKSRRRRRIREMKEKKKISAQRGREAGCLCGGRGASLPGMARRACLRNNKSTCG